MNIGIDYSPAEINPAGIGQYTRNMVKELIKKGNDNKYLIFSTEKINDLNKDNIENIVIPYGTLPFKGLRYMKKISDICKKRDVDILISFSNHTLALLFPRTILFIHDLAPLHYPQYFNRSARIIYPRTARLACNRAIKIIAVSNSVKNDIHKQFNTSLDKIEVIYPSLNEELLSNISKPFDVPDDFILSISTLEPRKNYDSAIKAFKLVHEQIPELKYLIIGKKGWYYEELFELVHELHLKDSVLFLGYRPDVETSYALSKAKAFLYLSHYEGFGMPPLEAIKYNVPLILSDIEVFRECFDGHAVFVDAKDVDLISEAIRNALEGKIKIGDNKEILKKFSWEVSANKLLSVIRGIK